MRIVDLFEAPISDFHHIGNWEKNSSFRNPQDRKLLTNPKAIKKMKSQWRFPEESMFNIILVNHPDGNPSLTMETGIVQHDWIADNMPRIADQVEAALDDSAINIIYTNNSGAERVPMTGWIMAHRLGHALEAYGTRSRGAKYAYYYHEADQVFADNLRQLMEEFYSLDLGDRGSRIGQHRRFDVPRGGHAVLGFLRAACTFRSAREHNIREAGEVLHESFAQYLFTGKVRFGDIPKSFKYGNSWYRFRGDEDDYDHANMLWRETGEQMAEYFETCISYCDGQILVM
jgi:hypothetical protein